MKMKMKRTITYQRVDPAGNITAFVFTPTPVEERVAIGRSLMEQVDTDIEQVGFITVNEKGVPLRMDMMGGEFCGNASRSLGLLQALLKKREGRVTEEVMVSGASRLLAVYVDTKRLCAEIALPKPIAIMPIPLEGMSYTAVHLSGILHILLPNREEDEAFVRRVLPFLKQNYPTEAYGMMFLAESQKEMVPYVYVTKADTLYREGSCGSGSFAVAVAKKDTWNLREKPVLLKQPRGTIELSLGDGPSGEEVRIGGEIRMDEQKTVQIECSSL